MNPKWCFWVILGWFIGTTLQSSMGWGLLEFIDIVWNNPVWNDTQIWGKLCKPDPPPYNKTRWFQVTKMTDPWFPQVILPDLHTAGLSYHTGRKRRVICWIKVKTNICQGKLYWKPFFTDIHTHTKYMYISIYIYMIYIYKYIICIL